MSKINPQGPHMSQVPCSASRSLAAGASGMNPSPAGKPVLCKVGRDAENRPACLLTPGPPPGFFVRGLLVRVGQQGASAGHWGEGACTQHGSPHSSCSSLLPLHVPGLALPWSVVTSLRAPRWPPTKLPRLLLGLAEEPSLPQKPSPDTSFSKTMEKQILSPFPQRYVIPPFLL